MSSRFKLKLISSALLACLFGLAISANAQQRPLITEDVDIIPPGSMRIEVGVDFMQKARFHQSNRKRETGPSA